MFMSAWCEYVHELKDGMFYSTRQAELNETFQLSPNEYICNIARMKNIHYSFYKTSK